MAEETFLGIDTSNYMTSICLIDNNRNVLFEAKKLLEVNQGKRGLRQSEVVFQHTKNLPLLFNKAKKQFENHRISAVAVSKKPRPKEDSYMPVFVPGTSLAESIAAILGIPVFYTTHQEGHIASGLFSSDSKPKSNKFLAVHLSGGTSEILSVKIEPPGYAVEKIGGTLDLHAGQLIDRIGVQMGLPFPAGSFFEALANKSKATFDRIPSSVSGLDFHLSGAEAEAKRRLIRNLPEEDIARAIEHVIASSLHRIKMNQFTFRSCKYRVFS